MARSASSDFSDGFLFRTSSTGRRRSSISAKRSTYPDGAQQTFIDQKVSVIRHGDHIGAISLVCQHLGCTVAPSATGYDCPCHGSKYDAMGNVTHGPAQIALFWFDVSLTPSGDLQVDKSKIVPGGTYYTTP